MLLKSDSNSEIVAHVSWAIADFWYLIERNMIWFTIWYKYHDEDKLLKIKTYRKLKRENENKEKFKTREI